jgi:hypothetical protein
MRMYSACGSYLRRCGYVAAAVAERVPRPSPYSHLHMGSLHYNNIGAAGARDLGAALRVNTTLTTLECGCACACGCV